MSMHCQAEANLCLRTIAIEIGLAGVKSLVRAQAIGGFVGPKGAVYMVQSHGSPDGCGERALAWADRLKWQEGTFWICDLERPLATGLRVILISKAEG